MSKVHKEVELKRTIEERNKVSSEQDNIVRIEVKEESSSSSLMSMYSTEYDMNGLEVSSCQSPN